MLMSSTQTQWIGTITENSAGTAATFVATKSVDSGNAPMGGTTTITATALAGTAPNQVLSVTGTNTFTLGETVLLNGTTETGLNGQYLTIATAGNPFSGTFNHGVTNYSNATEAGCPSACTGTAIGPIGFEVMNINASDPAFISGCTGVTAFNSSVATQCGHAGIATRVGAKVTSGSAAWSGTYNVAGVTVTYPWTATANAVDSTNSCTISNLQGGPNNTLITHNTFVTDTQNPIGGGPAPSTGASYQTNHLFRDSIILSGGTRRGWDNSPCGEGTVTEVFNYDTSSMTADHLVFPYRTAANYTEYGNQTSFPHLPSPGCTSAGCSPPITFGFPATDYCTGATSTPACVGFSGAMSLATGPMPISLADWHGYALRSDSTFHNAASDSTDIGINAAKIDAAQTANVYSGSSSAFPDNNTPKPSAPSAVMFLN
jgi:hypothetical protein